MFIRSRNDQDITYVNTHSKHAATNFSFAFSNLFRHIYPTHRPLVILCIGTDRVTGDALGPMIGYKLDQYHFPIFRDLRIYGTLQNPVHAMNLEDTLDEIYYHHHDPFIIAIDASLGRHESIGYLTLGVGSLKPGLGVNKELPEVGDMFITGIVNLNLGVSHTSIQNTRLGLVMQMADVAFDGLVDSLGRMELLI